jgi:hypothetical protein
MRHGRLADTIVAFSPAAHGTRPARQAEAMQAWDGLWQGLGPEAPALVLVQLAADPYDPNAAERLRIVEQARQRAPFGLLSIFHPDAPVSHVGTHDGLFDERFGAAIAAFADPDD